MRPSNMSAATQLLCSRCKHTICLTALRRPPWYMASRHMTRKAERRRPARLELSKNVAKPPLQGREKDRKSTSSRFQRNGPFAGMNRTKANISDSSVPLRAGRDGTKNNHKRARDSTKALKMQKALADVGYGARNAVKRQIDQIDSFDHFPLLPSVHQAVLSSGLVGTAYAKPTPIQRIGIPALMGTSVKKHITRAINGKAKQQFLLAAETGSGKTLAYLIPTIDAMKRIETEDVKSESVEEEPAPSKSLDLFDIEQLEAEERKIKAGRPRAIVLVPTSELVDQVGKVAKAMAHFVKFRTAALSANNGTTVIRNRLFEPAGIDLLITTPQLLANIVKSSPKIFTRVSHLIIDEADSLLDKSFEPFTKLIVEAAAPTYKQLIMCSATIPRKMDSYLRSKYPDTIRLTTPNLHAIPRRVQLGVVDVEKGNFFGNKKLACADTIWNIGKCLDSGRSADETADLSIRRIIVFVNERETSEVVANYLLEKGIDAVALNRDTPARHEKGLIAEFTEQKSKGEQRMSTIWEQSKAPKKLDQVRVLVTTDIAARGIDTLAVRDVILYDVPHSTIDFIHRLGRAGRMGQRGRGVVLVGKGDRRDVVSEIRQEMFRGQALI